MKNDAHDSLLNLVILGGGAATVAFVLILTSSFGFSDLWRVTTIGVMLAIWGLLIARRYPPTSWLLVFCVGGITVSTIALVRGYTLAEPERPLVDQIYENDYLDEWAYDPTIDLTEDESLLYVWDFEYNTYITVEFESVESLEGQWTIKDGTVAVSGALNGTFHLPHESNLPIFVPNTDSTIDDAKPFLNIDLPLKERHLGQNIEIEAVVSLTYWDIEEGAVVEQETTMQRSISLHILDGTASWEEEYDDYLDPYLDWETQQEEYERWEKATSAVEDAPGWPFLVLGDVVSILVAIGLVWRGRLLSQPGVFGSGLRVISQSGQERLGVEAYSSAQLHLEDATMPTEGAYLGRVDAQSPAGRAGLRSGDMVLKIDDRRVKTPSQLNAIIRQAERGEQLVFIVWRDGEEIAVKVTL